jgi:hypothetical protein
VRGQAIAGYVYDEIDTYMSKGQWEYAWDAIAKAINEYQDPKLRIYNCLWLYQKGAIVAEELGYSEYVLAFGNKFITLSEKLLNEGPHVRQVYVDESKIRPPRADEVDEAKHRLNIYEKSIAS